MKKNSPLAIVVMTSDKYFSLVNGFIYFFTKNSIFNDHEVFFGCESKTLEDFNNFTFVKTNKSSWSHRLFEVLSVINHSNVLLLLEDFYFLYQIDQIEVNSIKDKYLDSSFDSLIVYNGDRIKTNVSKNLNDSGQPDNSIKLLDKSIYSGNIISVGTFYKKDSLSKLLRRNENAWEFEFNGSFRASINSAFQMGIFNTKSSNENFYGYPQTGIIARGKLIERHNKEIIHQGYFVEWIDLISPVTTSQTPFFLRLIRIPPRYIKRYLNIFINKM